MRKDKDKNFHLGEVFTNPYLGDRTTEVLNKDKKRIGWVWEHSNGRIVVSPHIGFYVWFAENGEPWTMDTAIKWLAKNSIFKKPIEPINRRA